MTKRYDAVIVGGGHNGLVAAHYLAAAELSVLVLERRERVGGITSGFDFFPGYRAAVTNSPGSLEPKIANDMRLTDHGLTFDRPDPSVLVPFYDNRAFVGWRDQAKTREELAQFSRHDAHAYYEFLDFFNDLAIRMGISLYEPPPTYAELFARMSSPQDQEDLATVIFGSIRDMLDEEFESDEVKTILCMLSLAQGNVGPSTPGTPLSLMQRPWSLASTNVESEHDPRKQPLRGSTGLPRGGMGGIASAMEKSIRASGVDIRTETGVTHILTNEHGRVTGVVTEAGEEIPCRFVLSNLNPKTTMLDLVDEQHVDPAIRKRLSRLKMSGAAFKLILALDDIPRFACAPPGLEREYASCQFRVAPSMEYLERAYEDYVHGVPSRGPKLWGLTPSIMDPTLAPPGKHILSVNVWYAPYHLSEGTWETERDVFGKRCIDLLTEFVPNLKDVILDTRFLSPKDLEREFGLLEGHQLHGNMTPGRMFNLRPVAGLSEYRTPVHGLYLCGSGTWPGGFVSGLPGHNASHQLLRDLLFSEERGDEAVARDFDVSNRF